MDTISNAYIALDSHLLEAEKFVDSWTRYQALWELDVSKVYSFLGENADQWESMLNEIKNGKK